MNVSELIGKVAASFLRREIASGGWTSTDGTARFIIDRLSAEHTAAIARTTLDDETLTQKIELKLPAGFLADRGLPDDILTTKPATYWRTADMEKPVLLLANTGDTEQQSLAEFMRIGADQLQARPDLWVRVAGDGLALTDDQARWWEKALDGLQSLRTFSLDRQAAYVLRTRQGVRTEGLPLLFALGAALPALRLPVDRNYFLGLKDKHRGRASEWKRHFETLTKKRGCYLLKQTPTQLLLGEDELAAAFERVRNDIPEEHHPTVQGFIRAPSGWNSAAAALAECEWERVKPLFDGVRRERVNLGRQTLEFYDDRDPTLSLSAEDRDYLNRLVDRSTTEPKDEDGEFFEAHRDELRDDPKLKSTWDRFVFGKPRETTDFVAGLASAMESLFNQQTEGTKRRLRIRCDRATKKEFRELNVEAGLFFARRYAGLKTLLGSRVSWSVGQLFDYPGLVQEWKAKKTPLNHSTARASLQLKFLLELEVELPNGGTQISPTHLIWRFDPAAVTSQFSDDWARLEAHPLVRCRATRDASGARGHLSTVDLANVRTFRPAHGQERGTLVAAYKKDHDLAVVWRRNLAEAQERGLIIAGVASELEGRFAAFETAYGAAIRGFAVDGLSHDDLTAQLDAYAALLDAVCRRARGDRNRDLLLRPLLEIGAVAIDGGRPAVIVAPWHPLRLAAVAQKARLVACLVQHLLTANEVLFGDTRLFFKDLAQDLAHPYYPEVVLGWYEAKPELLAVTDVVQDYSLHEPPIVGEAGADDTNDNPTEGSGCVADLLQRYLALHPHERANMSVVLYDCDSARLPDAVVERLGALHDDDEDVRCQVLLRHSDTDRLRDLYTEIVRGSDADADTFNPSEATQDFLARLRICIIADQAPTPDPKEGRPYDIVFLQDVIARHARLEWYAEQARPVAADALVPSRWSRRRPAAQDDMKSVVYLCCPVQTEAGWAFLTALTSFIKGDWDEQRERRLLPARHLDFRDPKTARIFEDTHNLGNWVANYDELLDRRQLLNQNVRVIRYKQSATQGRNLVISSTASFAFLRSLIFDRLQYLGLDLEADEMYKLADRFIADATDISGDIVLRAAKRGRSASELMGIVLSRFLVRHELGGERHFGWYFLDDYADWLGQREEQIADVLALSPERRPDGGLRLAMIVSEAKYIAPEHLAAKRKESQKQLRDTLRRISDAVFGNPARLDRELWLARLSDLILDGVQFPASAGIDLSDWRRAVREGACDIHVRGYSHVFVPGPGEGSDCAAFVKIPSLEDAYQEVFGRTETRELVLHYFRGASPMPVRKKLAGEDIWQTKVYRAPSARTATFVKTTPSAPSGVEPPPPEAASAAPVIEQPPSAPWSAVSPPAGGTWPPPAVAGILAGSTGGAEDVQDTEWLKQVEGRARNALQQLQLQAKVLGAVLTPNSALLRFAGTANLTVDQLLKRRSELLTTYGLPIISVQPEPGAISVAIARPTRRVVSLREVWSLWNPDVRDGNSELPIGVREANGELLFLSPSSRHAPHTLIAGSTGSGKSVLMQNIILGIAATNTPAQAEIVLIDPKLGVDYFEFEGMPHLRDGVIDQQELALARLQDLVAEMDARYRDRFKPAKVSNLAAYNKKVRPSDRLPVIWLIHDEFAEWMMVDDYRQEVTSIVGRLGVKARAAGIHLVFAAQRPDANVMPMQLRANLGNRLILRVDSEGTSEIALGEAGAERLLGRGHLLARFDGESGLHFAQVPYVEPGTMEAFVKSLLSTTLP